MPSYTKKVTRQLNRFRLTHFNKLVALMVICLLVVIGIYFVFFSHAATPPPAAPPANYNYDYPRIMSYRSLNSSNLTCKMDDPTFQNTVTAANGYHFDKYTEVTVTGFRDTCDRGISEQFKRLYPDKLVINYENAEGYFPQTVTAAQPSDPTWPGYYYMMNRDVVTGTTSGTPGVIPSPTDTTVTVGNPSRFSVNDYALMYESKSGDPYGNAEYVQVTGISGNTLTITRNVEFPHNISGAPLPVGVFPNAGSGATFTTLPFIAALASVRSSSAVGNFGFNLSDMAPINPANGERAKDWLAKYFVKDFAADSFCPGGAQPTCTNNPTMDGMEFDVADWWPFAPNATSTENLDCDGDGQADYCNKNIGTSSQISSFGPGYEDFIHQIKVGLQQYNNDPNYPGQLSKFVMGDAGIRDLSDINGAEFESFPPFDDYTDSSAPLADLQFFLDSSQSPELSYAFTKDDSPIYQGSRSNPTSCIPGAPNFDTTPYECRNANYRYGLAASLITGGMHAYSDEGSFSDITPWDEDGIIDSSTTGLAPGYLGQPLAGQAGLPARQFNYTTGISLVNNPSFEAGLNGWSLTPSPLVAPNAATLSNDTSPSTASPAGSASAEVAVTGIVNNPQNPATIKLRSVLTGTLKANTEYAVAFWAKTDTRNQPDGVHQITVSLDGSGAHTQLVKVGTGWQQYYLNMTTGSNPTASAISFQLGQEIGDYWFDDVNVYEGSAGIITRQFSNGIAVLNDSANTQTNITLPGGPYKKINGVQDHAINDGSTVNSTLPSIGAKDGIVLLRIGSGKVGDINGDGAVDIKDLTILAANMRKSGQTPAQGDLNGDGTVDINDYAILAIHWGT